jgi:hypothetical protein
MEARLPEPPGEGCLLHEINRVKIPASRAAVKNMGFFIGFSLGVL